MMLLGYAVWGGAMGFAFERWLPIRVLTWGLAGIAIILTGEIQVRIGPPGALSWWNTGAFVAGWIVGAWIEGREQ